MLLASLRRAGRAFLPVGAALGLLLGSAGPAQAQQGAIAGTVVESQTLRPVAGAQVFIPGTDFGTVTNEEGRYRLTGVPAGAVTLQVRLIGYREASRSVTVVAGETVTAEIVLPVSAIRLEDVVVNVVTGLERRARELGANVTTIDAAAVNKGSITNMDQLLAGRAEGVVVQFTSGDVGAGSRIRIRGANSLNLLNEPLIFIDGIRATNSFFNPSTISDQDPSRLNDLNPEDIESIEVVKGPAASALYGAVGANGVILIRTKRGRAGRTEWNIYAEGAIQEDNSRWPDNFVAAQLREGADPNAPLFTEAGFNAAAYLVCPNVNAGQGLCRQDVTSVFNQLKDSRTTPFETGNIQTYGGSIAGGSDVASYFASGELQKTDGVIFFNEEDKVNTRVNLDAGVLDNLNASMSVGYVDRNNIWISDSNSIFSPLIAGLCGMAGFVPGTQRDFPISGMPPNDGPNPRNYCFNRNVQQLAVSSPSESEDRRLTGSLNTNWRPLSWLSAQGTFGLDFLEQANNFTIQPASDPLAAIWVLGFREVTRSRRENWTANASVSASAALTENIRSSTTLGGAYQEELRRGITCFGAGLVVGTASCSSTTTLFEVEEGFLNVKTLGGFAQQEFAFGDRLFLTGALRVDDDSNFGGRLNPQWYPAANVSYVMSDEEWFPRGGLITELRIRGGYGEAGTRPGFRQALALFSPVTVTVGAADVPGVTLQDPGNELLRPERVREFEGGVDLGLLDERLGLGFTYFQKRSSDALINRRLPPSFGLTASFLENLGRIQNKGTEVTLRAAAIENRNFRANFLGQFTTLDNEVLELGEGVEPIIFNRGAQRHDVGLPAGAFFNFPITFNDANGDGFIDPSEVGLGPDQVFLNEATPTWTASLTADLEFFQFLRFSSLVDARGGHSAMNFTEFFRCQRTFVTAGAGCLATGDPNASLEEQARFVVSRFIGPTTGFVESGRFLKWREFSVSISAPPELARKHRLLERSSLTVSGRNLAMITAYSGIDPEVNEPGANSNFTQSEFNTQPPLRIFTARVDFRF